MILCRFIFYKITFASILQTLPDSANTGYELMQTSEYRQTECVEMPSAQVS